MITGDLSEKFYNTSGKYIGQASQGRQTLDVKEAIGEPLDATKSFWKI